MFKTKEEKREGLCLNTTERSYLNSVFSGLLLLSFGGKAVGYFADTEREPDC